MSTKVFVGNLNFRTTQQQLSEAFSEVGQVLSIYMPSDRETGRPRGFAFVEFATSDEAQQAIGRFDGQELDGRKLRVNLAEERPQRSFGSPRPRSNTPTVGWAASAGAPPYRDEPRNFKTKGSRRNLRARKRSLNY
ncbi:MAG: RNA-binding protein [Candidatus Binatia bacterium]|nr:RNA-binding protein [Candidatus Binatia bacterium]